MCLAVEYGTTISDTIQKIKSDVEKMNKLKSECDIKVSQIYHQIENSNLNAAEGYKKYKELQLALRERRIVKEEHIALSNLLKKLDTDEIGNQIHRALQSIKTREANNQCYRQGWNTKISINDIVTI